MGGMTDQLREWGRKFGGLDQPQDLTLPELGADVAAGFVPGLGTAQALRDYERARREGDYLGMGLSAFGAVPVIGGIGKVANVARKGKGVANAVRQSTKTKNVDKAAMQAMIPEAEADIARSFGADARLKEGGKIPRAEVEEGLANRAKYREEPPTLPKRATEMSDQDWVDYGAKYGADFSQNPMQSLGVSDIATKRELMVPGGTEGKFTIPDLFRIKAENFDPSILDQDAHNALMKKFLRTYERTGPHDAVDTFNDLNFALLSPNAPLTQNEFLAQRMRAQTPEDLERLAARAPSEYGVAPGKELSDAIDLETGTGAGARGGLGVKGTAELGNQTVLAKLLREKPEMFRPGEGETLRDVGFRVMNQVPGLSVKTASLGIPWTDLNKANTSAVDMWMINKNYPRLAQENPEFAQRLENLTGTLRKDKTTGEMRPLSESKAAISIIGGGHPSAKFRPKTLKGEKPEGWKPGDVHPDLPAHLSPEKLAYEPESWQRPNDYYKTVMRYVDESRGANPEIELFPEQWRLWDRYRGRVEPHEMAHPDWRKIPKQSFSELQDALQAHRELGYMDDPKKVEKSGIPQKMKTGGQDWRRLYYGKADPLLLGGLAAGGGAAALAAALRNRQGEPDAP